MDVKHLQWFIKNYKQFKKNKGNYKLKTRYIDYKAPDDIDEIFIIEKEKQIEVLRNQLKDLKRGWLLTMEIEEKKSWKN